MTIVSARRITPKNHLYPSLLAVAIAAILFAAPAPAFAVNRDIVQLQTEVQDLKDQMTHMQQSFDERMGVMRSLIEQSTDNINKMNSGVTELRRSLQQQNTEGGTHIEQVSTQVQSLHDSVDEMKARLNKISKQLDDMNAVHENIATPAPNGMASAGAPPPAAVKGPPPDSLYNNALSDYNTANYDLAIQEFTDYLRYYGASDRAGNAQFYLADIEYKQKNYERAIKHYDKVLEQYPGGTKAAAAQLRKGFALMELGDRDSAIQELQSLISRYPASAEATQARERLRRMGVATTPLPARQPPLRR